MQMLARILRGELTKQQAKAQMVELVVEDGLLVACSRTECSVLSKTVQVFKFWRDCVALRSA
jgi:hypothetical protein